VGQSLARNSAADHGDYSRLLDSGHIGLCSVNFQTPTLDELQIRKITQ